MVYIKSLDENSPFVIPDFCLFDETLRKNRFIGNLTINQKELFIFDSYILSNINNY